MNVKAILSVSCLAGVAVGCGNILGLDDNKPVFDCSRCGTGYQCASSRLACVPIGGSTGAGGSATGQGGVVNGGTGASDSVAGTHSGGRASIASGGTATATDGIGGGVIGGTAGIGGVAIGGTTTGGTPPTVSGAGGVTIGGNGGTSDGGVGGTLGGNGGFGGDVAGAAGSTVSECKLSITPWPPPIPCRAHQYSKDFAVLGGTPRYTWSAPQNTTGLSFTGGDSGTLSGTMLFPGDLTLRVEDSNGQCGEVHYRITPRTNCWLAYAAKDGEGAQLKLHDPVLGNQLLLSTGEPLIDFKFSPDGRFIAYRSGSSSSQLAIAGEPHWTELPLDFEASSVIQYAWSPDSSVLAIAYTTDASGANATFLGGVRLSQSPKTYEDTGSGGTAGASATTSGGASGLFGISPIGAAKVVVDANSELVWFTVGNYVAYHAQAPATPNAHNLHVIELVNDHFAADLPILRNYSPALQLLPATNGIFAVQNDLTEFWDVPPGAAESDNYTKHAHDSRYVAPEGDYTAGNDSGFTVYSSLDGKTPLKTSAFACSTLLAWGEAGAQQRVACLIDEAIEGATTGKIRIFHFQSTLGKLDLLVLPVEGDYGGVYREGVAFQRRRAFSRSGNHFAFLAQAPGEDSAYVYVARLDDGSPRLDRTATKPVGNATNRRAELQFLPNERRLLVQLGAQLLLRTLNEPVFEQYLVDGKNADDLLPLPKACDESFTNAPNAWCGNTHSSSEFATSPDSRWVAFRTSTGKLKIIDLGSDAPGTVGVPIALCNTPQCAGSFAFQP